MSENKSTRAGRTITINLSSNVSDAAANSSLLESALSQADGTNELTVVIGGGDSYPVAKIIFLRSNTTLNLNGSTLCSTASLNNNLIRNCKAGVSTENTSNRALYTADDYIMIFPLR